MRNHIVTYILFYLRFFANIRIRRLHPTIVGVSGSSGKTSLVKLLSIILSQKYSVKQTGGKNSEFGLPLNILDVSIGNNSLQDWIRILAFLPVKTFLPVKKYDIYLAEMGIDGPDEPKNMSYLLKIIRPQVGMVTNVGFEHSVYFDPFAKGTTPEEKTVSILEMTANQEILLLTSLPENGTAIINLDDSYIRTATNKIYAKIMTISAKHTYADITATSIVTTLKGFSMTLVWKQRAYKLKLPFLLPSFYAYEFLFVVATGLIFDIPISESLQAIQQNFSLPAGRCSTFRGIKDTILIDSSYNNATREPILGMLDMLKDVGSNTRKLVILGDMRELGSQSKGIHEEVARKILKCANAAILIGPLMRTYVAPILRQKKFSFQTFMTVTQARTSILEVIQQKDIILIKGSQNTLFLERVVEMLLADKNDIANLCRRGSFWDAKRAVTL